MTPEIIYWDSDAFLGWLQNEQGKANLCRATFERAEKGEVILVTSALTIAEVLWTRNGPKLSKDKATLVRRFFRRSYIRVRAVTRSISESAQDVVWDHGIRPKDAIHVATALDAKVLVLETFDAGLISKSGTVGLTIRTPQPTNQGSLDLEQPQDPS
jgi:predicted nucleic acid-binding protein